MADLAKLASLSKKLKTSEPKTHQDTSRIQKGAVVPPVIDADAVSSASDDTSSARQPSGTFQSSGGGGGGGPANVNVKVDMSAVQDVLGRLRDEVRNLKDEIVKTREKGMKIDAGDNLAEMFDQLLKHQSAQSKALRELAEKLVTSLPESRWYGDLLSVGREVGENVSSGGGGGGGSNGALTSDLQTIKEALAMQQTQLTAIMSIMQRRG
jgi:hypothetical protein